MTHRLILDKSASQLPDGPVEDRQGAEDPDRHGSKRYPNFSPGSSSGAEKTSWETIT